MSKPLWWTDERRERLGTLIDQGLSGAEIGRRMGKSRSAIGGEASRLGWRIGVPRTEEQKKLEPRKIRPTRVAVRRKGVRYQVGFEIDEETFFELEARAKATHSSRGAVARELVEWGLMDKGLEA